MDSAVQKEHRVVVGVDGSDSSKEALRWAVSQAEATGATVDAVTTWEFPVTGWTPGVTNGQFAEWAEQTLNESVDDVVGPGAPVEVRRTVQCGNAAQVLIDTAKGADLLVVGSRGHGGFAGALLGSVGQHCAQHADCPVVIIRGETGGHGAR
ncbi:universal stress protein [Streptomyces sp. 8L]|uniref:universal stress protein n=1 Tax=Streptomyces sp. 8L TaxID=2877242 RepID=UPI001CD46FF6|nr:universal stress protein [Streptomyces sp. 8L]MCA1221227.1 universal stress protein [Streptomyces sp. 8L]